jgi:hypothetical protein
MRMGKLPLKNNMLPIKRRVYIAILPNDMERAPSIFD